MPLARLARRSPLALALALAAAGTLAAAAVASSRVVPPAGLVRAEPIGDLSAASAGRGGRAVALPLRYAHPGQLLAAKRAAFRRYRRARKHAGARRRPSHIRFKGTVFAGLNAPGFAFTAGSEASGYATPSDTTGAVGPSNYVQFTNGHLVVYDRSLAPVSGGESPIESFVGLPSGTDVAGDPQMQWDPVAQRWYYLSYASNSSTGATNFLMFGWSRTASPTPLTTTGWCKFALNTGALFPDFPKLGHNATQLIFGANGFQDIDQVSALIFVVPKPANGDATCPASGPVATQFGSGSHPLLDGSGAMADTPVPANTFDANTAGYVVSADAPDAVMIWHVRPSSTGPQLVVDRDIPVPTYLIPSNAPQPGTTNVIDTLDGRLTQAVAHANPGNGGRESVWTQHTISGPGGRSVVRWYEIVPATRSIRQRGTISDPSNFNFNGAVSPANDGRGAAVVYNAAGSGLRPAVRVSVRRPGAPLSTVGFPLAITSSASSFNDFSCNPPTPKDPPICRWGDYAGLTPDPDPAHTNLVWATQQYSAGNRWLTRNFAVQILAGGPKAALKVAPNPATAGKSVKFDGAASTDSLAPISAYNWDLDGNGTFETHTGASPKLNHTYHSAGKRRVRLRVIDANGDAADAGVTLAVVKPAACVSASKKRKQLASEVAQLKKRLKQAKTEDSRRRLRKQLDRKRAQLRKAHAAESRACRF